MAIAYENGVNLFDTAEVYASGRSLTSLFSFKQRNLADVSLKYRFPFLCDASSRCLRD